MLYIETLFTSIVLCYSAVHIIGCSKNPKEKDSPPLDVSAKGVTTSASGKRWSPMQVEVSYEASPSAQVKLKTTSQDRWPIIGFGGAIPEQMSKVFLKLNESDRARFIDAYFGPEGLDHNMLRLPVHATVEGYVFDNTSDDFALKNFDYNLTGDWENGKMEIIKRAMAKKKDLKILGSVWSPPSWMKLGHHSMNGSPDPCLKEDPRYHEVWAKYLVKWVEAYGRLGVPIWGITHQNEPSNIFTQSWATCVFEPEAQREFIARHLGPAVKAFDKELKLFFNDDDKNFLPDVAQLVVGNETAARYVDGAAVHWYTMDQLDALKDYRQKYLKTHSLISTEANNGDPLTAKYYTTDWDRGMHFVHGTIVDFVYGGSTAFMAWNMFGGENDSLIYFVEDTGSFQITTTYYTFGQITKYFKPGYFVLTSLDIPNPGRAADGVFPAGIEAMAAINPQRSEIVVVVLCDDRHESNATIPEFKIELDLGGGQFATVTLKDVEQRSVSTIVLTSRDYQFP